MTPVTYEPTEGVAVDMQDHTRQTGTIWTDTHGDMISSNLHGAEEPIRWMLRPHQGAETGQRWIRGFALENRRTLHWSVGLGRPRTSPLMIMTSLSLVDILGGRFGSIGTCGRLEKPN
jgi:hypothetical protein